MNTELLNIFLSEDGDTHAGQKLLSAIGTQRAAGSPMMRKFTFNRFNVTLDFEAKVVFLQDDLTVGPQGEYKLSMSEFEKALRERR